MLTSTDQHVSSQPAPPTRDVWNRHLVYVRIILITVILVGILFWFSSQIIVVLLIFLVAAMLAYAIVPVIDLSENASAKTIKEAQACLSL